MGEHVDTRQIREQKARRSKKRRDRADGIDDGPRKKPKTFKEFINSKTGTYEPEDGFDDDDVEYKGLKIK